MKLSMTLQFGGISKLVLSEQPVIEKGPRGGRHVSALRSRDDVFDEHSEVAGRRARFAVFEILVVHQIVIDAVRVRRRPTNQPRFRTTQRRNVHRRSPGAPSRCDDARRLRHGTLVGFQRNVADAEQPDVVPVDESFGLIAQADDFQTGVGAARVVDRLGGLEV